MATPGSQLCEFEHPGTKAGKVSARYKVTMTKVIRGKEIESDDALVCAKHMIPWVRSALGTNQAGVIRLYKVR